MARFRRTVVASAALAAALAVVLVVRTDTREPRHVQSHDLVKTSVVVAVDAAGPSTKLLKEELRPRMKAIVPLLDACYEQARAREPQISGVINTRLTIHNEPQLGMTFTVNGFDTDGPLGQSRDFLACVTTTIESAVLPPLATRGTLDVTYPTTFAPQPPDNRGKNVVDTAAKAALDGRWSEALDDAERGLRLTSLDGPHRRRLIEVAGISACHLKNEKKARQYFSLASPELENRLHETCLQVAAIDLAM